MASRACGNRLSLRNQYDTKTPRASILSQGSAPDPAPFRLTGRTKLASRKIHSVGFEQTLKTSRVTLKMSDENFLEPGNRKISRSSRITAGLKLREAAKVFSNVPPE
jgi:hypothetical protein